MTWWVKNSSTNLVERGLTAKGGLLVVIDGSKALRKAVKDVFGEMALVRRCQVHKKRNVLEHLPEKKQQEVAKKLDAAWREKDYQPPGGSWRNWPGNWSVKIPARRKVCGRGWRRPVMPAEGSRT